MNHLKRCAFAFGCIAAFLAGPALSYAATQSPSSEVLPQALRSSADELALPRSLSSWGSEDPALISLLPQQRMAVQPPFIDFGKAELGGFIGAVKYSADFDADVDIAGGITGRVPVPGLPGNWGLWASLAAAGMTRDIPFFYPHRSGTWFSANVGADYTLTTSEIWLVRAQAGVTYNYWNNLQGLDNNFAGTVGLDIGFYWIKFNHRTTVNLNPQVSFNGSNWYAILGLEFQVQF
ncbi:MAG: hypothetical protein JO332_02940 [Planctomycetaceae bacterium]|nr:hypothetical protein [Planctomycetaceae bacterium]